MMQLNCVMKRNEFSDYVLHTPIAKYRSMFSHTKCLLNDAVISTKTFAWSVNSMVGPSLTIKYQ